MKFCKVILLINSFFLFICILRAENSSKNLCILKTASAHTWEKIFKELGYFPRTVDIKTPELFSNPSTKIIIIPDDFMLPIKEEEKILAGLKEYICSGGQIFAVGKAGYRDGVFWLTDLLRAGASRYAYALGILYNYKYKFDIDKFKEKAVVIMKKGGDGLVFMDFLRLKAPSFTPTCGVPNDVSDFEGATKYVFYSSEKWRNPTRFSITPVGCLGNLNMIWLRDWMLYRNKGMGLDEIVDTCLRVGANGIIFDFRFGINGAIPYQSDFDIVPGKPTYKSKLYEQAERELQQENRPNGVVSKIQETWMSRLVQKCKEHNLILWISIGPLSVYREYPEDKGIDIEGNPTSFCPYKFSQRTFHHKARLIEEMLKKFPYISGICLDEPVHHVFYKKQSSKVAECFCQECKRRFFEYSGRELNKKTVYEKFKDSEVAAELKKDTAYRKGERSDIYQQFLQDGIVANCVERYSLLLKRIKPDAVLIVANYIKRGKWENRLTNKLADAGVDILLPEFGAGYSILPIPWNHNIQYFEFFSLKDGNSTKPLWGDAVKVKLFDGSNVEAWVTDGNYNYPGIVKANDGKTCYISFDPISIDWESGKKIIQNVLNKFGK